MRIRSFSFHFWLLVASIWLFSQIHFIYIFFFLHHGINMTPLHFRSELVWVTLSFMSHWLYILPSWDVLRDHCVGCIVRSLHAWSRPASVSGHGTQLGRRGVSRGSSLRDRVWSPPLVTWLEADAGRATVHNVGLQCWTRRSPAIDMVIAVYFDWPLDLLVDYHMTQDLRSPPFFWAGRHILCLTRGIRGLNIICFLLAHGLAAGPVCFRFRDIIGWLVCSCSFPDQLTPIGPITSSHFIFLWLVFICMYHL